MCKSPPLNGKAIVWHPDDDAQPMPSNPDLTKLYRPEVLQTIESKIRELDAELRSLSLDIHCMSPPADDLHFLF